jgi:predicted Zn-dependent protease
MGLALALAPDDIPLQMATAAAEFQAGRLDDALTHVRAGQNTAVGQALLGDIEEKRGRYLEAAKAYQQAVALAPDQEQYRIALALELVQHYSFEPAIAVLQQASSLCVDGGDWPSARS